MNNFTSTENTGLLKISYDGDKKSPLQKALKRKRERLAETKLGLVPEDESEAN